jgi:anti-sigma factor ChrR (cupin superfamily)
MIADQAVIFETETVMKAKAAAAQSVNTEELRSRYIRTDDIPWQPMQQAPGVQMKVLYQDEASGHFTGLFKIEPGGVVPDHIHQAVEQTYVLEGTFADQEGTATAGDFIWRPAGNRHEAYSPDGCIILGMFLAPNKFF